MMTKPKKTTKKKKTPTDLVTAKVQRKLKAGVPKLAEHKELVEEVQGLVRDFTQKVQEAAERCGIEVDVIVQVSPKRS